MEIEPLAPREQSLVSAVGPDEQSANAIPRDIEKGLAAGFIRYLTKPIKVDDFMKALDEALALAAVEVAPGT